MNIHSELLRFGFIAMTLSNNILIKDYRDFKNRKEKN